MRELRWWGLVVIGLVLPLGWVLWGWENGVSVSVVSKVKPVTVLEYGGRLFAGSIPLSVELTAGAEPFSFTGSFRLKVLSNTPWKLQVSLKGLRVGGEEIRPDEVLLVWDNRKAELGASSDTLITGDRGIWPLEFGIVVAVAPEIGGSVEGEAELILEISLSGARP